MIKLKTVLVRICEIPPTFPKNASILVTDLYHIPSLVYAENSTVIIVLTSLCTLFLSKIN